MKLSDLKIIITGAGGGMGAHFATRVAEAGGHAYACDLNQEGLGALEASVAGAAGKVTTRVCNVSDDEQVGAMVDHAFEAMGGLNGLVNNAGIIRDGLLVKKDRKTGDIIKMSREQWQQVIDVNLTGATMVVRDAVAKMAGNEQQPGVIINMSSVARHGNRGQSNYVAAKSALAANTVTWAREFSRFGIRVGAIAPGMIETPMTVGMNQKARDALVAAVPCGRIGKPEDIWQAVRFIVECDYFTGRVVDVDGGLQM
ncbi:MAG: SDR family oxidoreductase [Deltaproteobacteria bacterium]|nr:SDR family oxidoreductase [Deltaproteobacteria bacterium]